jgi:hypothetical protein
VIAAFDFFTVPTLSFGTLYCFVTIEVARRRILQFNATLHPTSNWIVPLAWYPKTGTWSDIQLRLNDF